jgi:hypothetical protein
MFKKILMFIVILVLLTILIPSYYYFWPRYVFKDYGYHDIKTKNELCDYWWITLSGSSEPDIVNDFSKWQDRVFPHFKKTNINGSPYRLDIWHCSKLKITKVDIMKSQNVVFSSDDVKQVNSSEDRVLSQCQDIKLGYDDYVLVIYYSLKNQDNIINYTLEEPLKINFVEEKVSLFEIDLGI